MHDRRGEPRVRPVLNTSNNGGRMSKWVNTTTGEHKGEHKAGEHKVRPYGTTCGFSLSSVHFDGLKRIYSLIEDISFSSRMIRS